MYIEVEKTNKGIVFRLSGETLNFVNDWEFTIDKAVFEEQLASGLFRGHELDPNILAVMQLANDQGRIMPYYGAGGSRGVCVFTFKPSEKKCQLSVRHSATNEELELSASLEELQKGLFKKRVARFKFSPLPYFMPPEELPDEWQTNLDTQMHCPVVDKEYETLKAWDNWEDQYALTGRYEYEFGAVSLGTGFTVKVRDSATDDSIDITDYDDW